jgi:hypothetical protein
VHHSIDKSDHGAVAYGPMYPPQNTSAVVQAHTDLMGRLELREHTAVSLFLFAAQGSEEDTRLVRMTHEDLGYLSCQLDEAKNHRKTGSHINSRVKIRLLDCEPRFQRSDDFGERRTDVVLLCRVRFHVIQTARWSAGE